MELVDTHCHIQTTDYPLSVAEVEEQAAAAGVSQMICVGCTVGDSVQAVQFAATRPNVWASIGIHPHEAKGGERALEQLRSLLVSTSAGSGPNRKAPPTDGPKGHGQWGTPETNGIGFCFPGLPKKMSNLSVTRADASSEVVASDLSSIEPQSSEATGGAKEGGALAAGPVGRTNRSKIVAIGECGLDYFYGHSSKADQEKALRYQIELALEHDLPLIFHVRDAFDNFWPIFNDYKGIKGELHSFTDSRQNLDKALEAGLFIGVNGITTFTKNDWQLENITSVPLERLLLETDAPFLTPSPLRGRVNEPAHVLLVAQFLADLKGISLEEIAHATTKNARQLFSLILKPTV